MIFVFVWLSSLSRIISRFIHVAAADIISFFLWPTFHCIYQSCLLYSFICWWTFRTLSLFFLQPGFFFSNNSKWYLPFPLPGDPPALGIEPISLVSPALAGRLFTTCTAWEAQFLKYWLLNLSFFSCTLSSDSLT